MSPETCPFCEIVSGRRPQEIVYSDDTVMAFLCEPPANWGHALVIPLLHRTDIWDIAPEELAATAGIARILAGVLRDELGAVGVNIRQNSGVHAGQDVFHFHMHIVPRYEGDTLLPGCVWGESPWQPPSGGDLERRRVATLIRRGLAARNV
jgi:histidine triad (HIT) family protein